jgi:hypothetical protein
MTGRWGREKHYWCLALEIDRLLDETREVGVVFVDGGIFLRIATNPNPRAVSRTHFQIFLRRLGVIKRVLSRSKPTNQVV